MTLDELKEVHVKTCQKCLITMLAKNGAYNGYEDALGNFKSVETKGICTAEQGILVRLSDKMERMQTLIIKGGECADEAVVDTVDDAINYLILLKAILIDKHRELQ